jgi:ParB family chromosome partitioning protein
MKERGYSEAEIANKTGLSPAYVQGVSRLLEQGEHRLLRAVESGQVPLSVAVMIAETPDADAQEALQQAYENKTLRGKRLLAAKKLLELRRRRGKAFRSGTPARDKSLSSTALVRAYQQETDKKRLLVQKAEGTRNRLMFVTEALKSLYGDENFVTLLRAEGLDSLPRNLADRIQDQGQI